MLNDIQSREYNRASKLSTFLNTSANTAIWSPYGPFKKRVVRFNDQFTIFTSLVPEKQQNGKGITLTKSQLQIKLANEWGDILTKTLDYAIDNSLTTLQAAVNYSADDIIKMKDSEIFGFAQNLNTNVFTAALMADTEFLTYEVTATAIAAALLDASNFNDLIGDAKVIDSTAAIASADIDATILKIKSTIASMNRLKVHFSTSNPSFVSGFDINSKRDDVGIHHTGITGIITIGGVPSPKGAITVGNKTTNPDLYGKYTLIKIFHGDHPVTATVPGLPPKTVIHHFISGHIDQLDFEF